MLRDLVEDQEIKEELLNILDIQMATASVLAADCDDCPVEFRWWERSRLVSWRKIDEMDASLEPLTSFVIPGGHPAVSQAHVARTVCRRTERTYFKTWPGG